jgi:superfamily II DNA helicase RecQ
MPTEPLHPLISSTIDPDTQPVAANTAEYFGSVLLEDIVYLRAFLKDCGAMFRSPDQYQVYRNVFTRSRHTVHITKTGGGKTLPLMLALKRWEHRVKLVVVEPFIAVYGEMKKRFDAAGLPAQILDNSEELDPSCRVYILSINTLSLNDCHTRIRNLAQRGDLGAVFLDECDGPVSNDWRDHYEWAYRYALQLPDTALVFASATMPLDYMDAWLDKLGIKSAVYPGTAKDTLSLDWTSEPSPLQIVRHYVTDRLNIRYEARPYDPDNCDSSSTMYQDLCQLVEANPGQTMVFTTTPAMAEQLADWLGEKRIVHGKILREDRIQDLTDFALDKKGVLVGTKAAYYGIDIPGVRLVVFVVEADHYTPNLVEFAQGSGRAGRNGQSARCVVFFPNFTNTTRAKPHRSWSQPKSGDFNGAAHFVSALKDRSCIRAAFSSHLDGWHKMDCSRMKTELEYYDDGNLDAVHMIPCSHCVTASILDSAEKRYVPIPRMIGPPLSWEQMDEDAGGWADWVPELRRPEPHPNIPRVTWGNVPLPKTSPSMQKLAKIMQNTKQQRMAAKSIVGHLLSQVRPFDCLGCLTYGTRQDGHATTDCKQSWWRIRGDPSALATRYPLNQGSFKRCWTEFLGKHKHRGACFSCLMPQAGHEYHNNGDCVFPKVSSPLLWVLRHSPEYRDRVRKISKHKIDTLEDFDRFVFSPTNTNDRAIINGSNIIVRDWFQWMRDRIPGYQPVETEEALALAWRRAIEAYQLRSKE